MTQKEMDSKLRDDVIRELDWEPSVPSQNINVAATEGVVTLTGFVHTLFEKYAAAKTAQSVQGVKAIADDIEVKPAYIRVDPEIARDLAHALEINTQVPKDQVKAVVVDGLVTLKGIVEWNYQRQAAEACVRDIAGVKGVVNHIKIKPKASAVDVAERIDEALRRSAEVDASHIGVSATDTTVYLSGKVRSMYQRAEAERAAWAAPGVVEVIDDIRVVPA